MAQVEGDSMSPTLEEGDLALADSTLKNLQDGKMFLFEIPGDGHTIKRVFKNGKGWELHSDNRAYKMKYLPKGWIVVGQVYDALGSKGVT